LPSNPFFDLLQRNNLAEIKKPLTEISGLYIYWLGETDSTSTSTAKPGLLTLDLFSQAIASSLVTWAIRTMCVAGLNPFLQRGMSILQGPWMMARFFSWL
jgi:hypothetical protein